MVALAYLVEGLITHETFETLCLIARKFSLSRADMEVDISGLECSYNQTARTIRICHTNVKTLHPQGSKT